MKIKKWIKRIALMLTAVLAAASLTACADEPTGRAQKTSDIADGTVINTVTVGSQTIEWVNYTDPDNYFTAMVPKGWQVNTTDLGDGGQTQAGGMTVAIVSPDASCGVIYTDHAAFKAASLSSATAEAYLKDLCFNPAMNEKYAALTIQSVTPSTTQSTIGFSSDADGAYITPSDASTIRFTLPDTEGELSASVYTYLTTAEAYYFKDILLYMVPAGQLDQWYSVLRTIRSSLNFTQAYQQRFQKQTQAYNGTVDTYNNFGTGTIGTDTFDMSDSYAARQKAQDIQSEKFKDYILGNDRMQDNSTGAIYNTDPSFYEDYQKGDGQRYSPITDDQYLQDTSGTIGW